MKYIVEETISIKTGIITDIIFEEDDPTDILVLPAKVDGVKIVEVYNFPAKTQLEISERLKNFNLIIEEGIQQIFNSFSAVSVKTVSIPKTLIRIPAHFCFNCRDLTIVNIATPSSLQTISISAFKGCINLSKFDFPVSLTKIDSQAFFSTGLKSVTFPERSELDTINFEAFKLCGKLKKVDLGHTKLKTIPRDAFSNDVSLKKVVFPRMLQEIEVRAFYETDLSDASLSECEYLTSIGTQAFRNSHISDGCMPISLQYISNEAFQNSSIKVLTFNSYIKEIGIGAFSHSPLGEIKNIQYLRSAKVKDFAFAYCMFSEITLPNCNWKIQAEIFSENYWLETVKFEDDITEIPRGMFKNCTKLSKVKFPTALQYINPLAFKGTNIEELDFSQCDDLTVGKDVFEDTPSGYRIKMSPYTCIKDNVLLKYTECMF